MRRPKIPRQVNSTGPMVSVLRNRYSIEERKPTRGRTATPETTAVSPQEPVRAISNNKVVLFKRGRRAKPGQSCQVDCNLLESAGGIHLNSFKRAASVTVGFVVPASESRGDLFSGGGGTPSNPDNVCFYRAEFLSCPRVPRQRNCAARSPASQPD